MKGKFKLLGHIGLALFLVSALVLTLAPVAQASSVSSVWMEFETAAHNDVETAAEYTIHFTTGTALSRGVDTITVIFPDGLDSTMGPTTTQDSYDFELGSADTTAAYYNVDPTGDPLLLGTSYVTCTAVATIAGYRVQVTTPVDIPAGTAATLKIETSAAITTPAVAASTYKIKVATSQDTSFVLSSAFSVDDTVLAALISTANYPSSLVAGAAAAYKWTFEVAGTVAIGGTVTVEFPVGTYLPSTIDTSYVTVGNGTDDPNASAVSVDTAARTVTVTTQEALTTSGHILYFTSQAGIKNPTTIGIKHVYMWTSTDGQKFTQTDDDDDIVAGTATALAFTSDSTLGYSDDATILYAYTDKLYIDSVDTYGHKKAASPTEPTIALSVVTGTGAFYTDQAGTAYTNTALSSAILGTSNQIYYRPTSAGTHTLKAEVVSGTSLTEATWTVYVAPAVVLKDANSETIGTYGPTSTSTTDHTYGGAWVQAAINAAFPGDTVELGGSSGATAIYELSTAITLSAKVTLTSQNGASYTTLRPTDEMDKAIQVTTSGTAAYPVIIDGLTFDRLRLAQEFDVAVSNSGYDYLTVRNCAFNYIIPDASGTTEAVVWFLTGNATITSATVSDNTFTNCVGFNAISGGRTGVIQFYEAGGTSAMSGVTISGNTITSCNDYGIAIGGSGNHAYTASITNNTITNGYSPICLNAYNTSGAVTFTVTGNTITGGYRYGIRLDGDYYTSVAIKNNTITGCAGAASEGAIYIPDEDTASVIAIQYNDISGNNGYAIYAAASPTGGHDCKYNYFGDATGPAYTALTGATVGKSNTGGAGDAITDKVCYYPWLHKSKADVVTDNASYQACTMSLVSGWNTLSTPVKLISTADSIDELIPSGMSIGYYYDATGWQQITTGYVLNTCDAVYVKMSAATDVLLKFDASAYTNPSKALSAGWNLISLAYLSSSGKHADDAVASVYLTAAGLPGYSQVVSPSLNASQTNMYGVAGASWAYSSGQTLESPYTETMYAGLGYWCYMQNAVTLAGFEITPIAPDLD